MREKHRILMILAACVLFISAAPAGADTVMKVINGDTVEVSPDTGGAYYTCTLYGIDAPEPGQDYSRAAWEELSRLVLLQTVDVTFKKVKSYTREVCLIKVRGMDAGLQLVRRGYAWAYNPDSSKPPSGRYGEAERNAREKKRGLWKDQNPIPPWEFGKKK